MRYSFDMDPKEQTIRTYDERAHDWAAKFVNLGARIEEIERALSFLPSRENIRALELGCGYGREGSEIAKRVAEYVGIDASKEFVAMAKERYPQLNVSVADMEEYEFPKVDVIFAFASLLHVQPTEVKKIFQKAHASLSNKGIFSITLQEGEGETLRDEPLGKRMFYLYTPEKIQELAENFEEVYLHHYELNGKKWFEIVLGKNA